MAITTLLGWIRNKPEVDDTAADAVLSLNIISAKNMKSSHNSNRYDSQPICVSLHTHINLMCLFGSAVTVKASGLEHLSLALFICAEK